MIDLRAVVEVLRFVVVELARRDDFAGHRRLAASSLPSTAHSISRASGTAASTTILRSKAPARSMRRRPARRASLAFEMPTLDPRLAGLTNIGKPSARSSSAAIAVAAAAPTRGAGRRGTAQTGSPARREQHLHHRLVHADRRGEHAGADVRHVGQLEQPLDRAVLAVRSVQHRKDDVEVEAGDDAPGPVRRRAAGAAIDREDRLLARPRHQVHFAAAAQRPRGLEARLLDHFGRRHRRRRPIGERPPAVLLDPDRHRLVARAVEIARTPPPPTPATLRARPIVRRRARRPEVVSRQKNTGDRSRRQAERRRKYAG